MKHSSHPVVRSASASSPRHLRPERRVAQLQELEPRRLMAIAQNADGWTVVTPSSDSRLVYVSSSSGDDANSGLSPTAPVRTIAAGRLLLRTGNPDHLLLKRGDVFHGSLGVWNLSGRDADEPMVLGAYGTGARPIIKTGNLGGLNTDGWKVHDFAILGVHFYANGRDVNSPDFVGTAGDEGLRLVGGLARVTVEDTVVDGFAMNVEVNAWNGRPSDIRLRRNAIVNSYSAPGGTSSGIYMFGVDRALIEGNVIDQNGWHPTLAGMNAYGHNVYVQADTTGIVIKDNIIANAGSHGLQARSGGVITGNLFLRNPIHMSFGMVNGGDAVAGGVTGEISGNVFLEGRKFADPNTTRGAGWAIEVSNTAAGRGGTAIRDNIFSLNNGGNNAAIRIDIGSSVTNFASTVGVNDLTIERNKIFKWFRGLHTNAAFVNGGTGTNVFNDVVVRDNDFQSFGSTRIVNYGHAFDPVESRWSESRYFDADPASGWFGIDGATTSFDAWRDAAEPTATQEEVDYPDPHRTMTTYNARLGGAASTDAFLAEARLQSRLAWRDAYTAGAAVDYVRAGFGLGTPPRSNAAPVVNAGANKTATEGQSVGFAGAFTDADIPSGDTHTIAWDFGDDTPRVTGTLTPSHRFADNGTFTVRLTVTDAAGAVASDVLTVTVANAAPVVTAPSTLTGTAGTAIRFSGSVSDAGSDDTHTIRWDFGDGTSATGALAPSHTYAAAGTYAARLTVTDDDGGADTAAVTVTVSAPATSVLKKLYTTNTAYVRGGTFANTNFGFAKTLETKVGTADLTREAYLRYDLSSITTITSAKLRLYGRLSEAQTGGVTVNVYNAANTTWNEATLTYNNRPAAGTTVRGSKTVTSTSNAWCEIDLTAFIKAEKAAGRNLVTLVLRAAAPTAARTLFNSDDSTTGNRPELAIRT